MKNTNKILFTGDMIELFNCSRPTFWRWRQTGHMPPPSGHIGTGGRPFWLQETAQKTLDSLTSTPDT